MSPHWPNDLNCFGLSIQELLASLYDEEDCDIESNAFKKRRLICETESRIALLQAEHTTYENVHRLRGDMVRESDKVVSTISSSNTCQLRKGEFRSITTIKLLWVDVCVRDFVWCFFYLFIYCCFFRGWFRDDFLEWLYSIHLQSDRKLLVPWWSNGRLSHCLSNSFSMSSLSTLWDPGAR